MDRKVDKPTPASDPAEMESDKLFCCRWVRHRVPQAHREELYHILKMTVPLLLSRILNYLLPFVVTMFCGRLGNDVMAGYGLASATINITTAATGGGLGLACDTLISQTFGGKNLLRVGVILQRAIIILMMFCLPCWGLLINAEAILLCMAQDPEVARIAQLYIVAFLPAVPVMFLYQLLNAYLQNQGILLPQLYTAAMANIANLVTNYIFIYWLDLGVRGSAAANALSWFYIFAFLLAYIWWKKLHVATWGGWSVESLQEWGSYMKLAIPSTLMTCFEWWLYEFGGFFAGMLSEDELAAQHAVIMVAFITYMFPLGIQAAACVRVGNALGAGDTARAILTSKMSLTLAGSFGVVEGLILGSTKTVIGFIFTSDEKIIGLVSHLMTAYCFLQFFDGLVCVCTGIFLGTGKQKIPAVANFIGYYGIGLSLSIIFMFVVKLRVFGFWLGLLVCVVLQSTFYIIVIFRLNWERLTEEAVKRAQKKTHMILLSTAALSEAAGYNTADQTATNGSAVDGYMSVNTECHDGNTDMKGGHEAQHLRGGRLSTTQLVLRRGLTMFAAIGLLAVGASVHFLVPLPEMPSSEANLTLDWINTTYTPNPMFSTVLIPTEQSGWPLAQFQGSCDHSKISILSNILESNCDKFMREKTDTSVDSPALASHAADMERSSDKLFCCGWVCHRVPQAHREELYHILRMTGPLLLSRILNCLLPFVITMFCGRLGNEVMAGYGLASATINVTTAATGCGLGLACDTLVSQTFGGKNLLRVGVILQRGIIILLMFCLPCWGLLINAQAILLCLGQDPEVARIAQLYITSFLPAVPAMFLHHLQVSYLQNQGIILPQMYAAAMANFANVVTNYIFLNWLNLGVSGSAAANTLSQIYICAFLFAYIWWKKLHVTTWGGWSVESLQEWGSYMKLAIPSTLMKCFEWWVYEFGGFFAGMLSEDELAAQHAVIMVAFITYMIPFGIQAAACARVGNALGAGDSARAILTSKVSLTLAGSFAVVEGIILGSTKTMIGFIFTSDEKIIGLVSHLMNAYCFLQFFDGLVCVCTGIFLGTGKQKIPAVANFIGYYGIGLSLSVTFMFAAKLRVLGFWLGLLVCVVLQSTFYIIVIFRLNWERMTEEAVERAQKNIQMTLLSTAALSDTADQTATNGSSVDGYVPVSTESHDGNTDTQGGRVLRQLRGGRLSTTQLILRRGLTMFAAVALLAVGASVHFLVPLPEMPSSEANLTLDWINTTYNPDESFSATLLPN